MCSCRSLTTLIWKPGLQVHRCERQGSSFKCWCEALKIQIVLFSYHYLFLSLFFLIAIKSCKCGLNYVQNKAKNYLIVTSYVLPRDNWIKILLTSYCSTAAHFAMMYGRRVISLESAFWNDISKNKILFFFLNIISQMNFYCGSGLWMNTQGYDKLDFILDMLSTLWYTFRENIEKKWEKNRIASHCLNRCFYTKTIVLFCFFYPTNGNVLLNILLLKSR